MSIVLPYQASVLAYFEMRHGGHGANRTSFLVTGFSDKLRCVSRRKFLRGSRSASSAKLLDVRMRVSRLGMEFGIVNCIELTLFLARRRTRNRGDRGKLAREAMSLSVKSMASDWS